MYHYYYSTTTHFEHWYDLICMKLWCITIPISCALTASGRRSSVTNFLASNRISITLFKRAKSGARGKEATKSDTKPNWMTADRKEETQINRWYWDYFHQAAFHHLQALNVINTVCRANLLLFVYEESLKVWKKVWGLSIFCKRNCPYVVTFLLTNRAARAHAVASFSL